MLDFIPNIKDFDRACEYVFQIQNFNFTLYLYKDRLNAIKIINKNNNECLVDLHRDHLWNKETRDCIIASFNALIQNINI